MRSCHRGKQVRRERRNAALARQVIADKRDLANFGTFFHKAVFHSSRPALLCTRVCARQLQMCRLSVKWEGAFSGSVDSVLRAVVFKARGSTDPMRVGRSAGKDIRPDAVVIPTSLPSYPSAWLHPRSEIPDQGSGQSGKEQVARCRFTWQNHCTSHRDWRSDF